MICSHIAIYNVFNVTFECHIKFVIHYGLHVEMTGSQSTTLIIIIFIFVDDGDLLNFNEIYKFIDQKMLHKSS